MEQSVAWCWHGPPYGRWSFWSLPYKYMVFTGEQLNIFKAKSTVDGRNTIKYSIFEIRIHDALARADNYYLRSFLIYLELNHPRLCELDTEVSSMRCPILWINSWIMLPIHDADFGTNLHGTLCNAS
ncbi:hypothetical protein DVH24_000016 [Malus domestica]|uniref:Uncharacterized protein n=1 Tax=Malus domestica TaxID=3750 RepID=A0A498J1I4_MALDO|nr:hypothetical protein DVH24_000016 [Malus domestica]